MSFCHYRRYFDIPILVESIDSFFISKDVIVCDYQNFFSVEKNILRYIGVEDLHIFLMCLKKLYPEYEQTVLQYLWGYESFGYNMLVCKKLLFDKYAEWLFSLFTEFEKFAKKSPYNRASRSIAYLGEFFMPVYMIHNGYKCEKVKVINWPENIMKKNLRDFVKGYVKKYIPNLCVWQCLFQNHLKFIIIQRCLSA